jgi:hypothetical protein
MTEVKDPPSGKVRLLTLSDLDRRTNACRHALELRGGIVSDLGGDEHISLAQRELAQRAAVLGAMLEDAEARYLRGDDLDLPQFCTLVNAQRRVLADIGLDRVARTVSPDIRKAIQRAKRQGDDA